MKLVICFIIFGFLFGLLNKVDSTGGDIPYSMMLNIPTLYAQGLVSNVFNKLEEARVRQLREKLGISDQDPFLSKEEFEKFSPNEREEFISKMVGEKNLIINDPFIGKKGILRTIRDLISFPVISTITWGLIGFVIYIITIVLRKVQYAKV